MHVASPQLSQSPVASKKERSKKAAVKLFLPNIKTTVQSSDWHI